MGSRVVKGMTRMSGSCRPEAGSAQTGFTLLEILIVLALVAVLAALVAPRLSRTYEAVAGSGERAEVVRQLERLPLRARSLGVDIHVEQDAAATLAEHLTLPQGWQVRPLDDLAIQGNGICKGGRVEVSGLGAVEIWVLQSPGCGVVDGQ